MIGQVGQGTPRRTHGVRHPHIFAASANQTASMPRRAKHRKDPSVGAALPGDLPCQHEANRQHHEQRVCACGASHHEIPVYERTKEGGHAGKNATNPFNR